MSEVVKDKGGVQGLRERWKELNKEKNDKGKGGETGVETDKASKGKKEQDGKSEGGGGGKSGEGGGEGKNSEGSGEGKGGEAQNGGKAGEAKKAGDGNKEKAGKGKGKEKQGAKEDENENRVVFVDEGDDLTIKEVRKPKHTRKLGAF